MYHRRKKTAPDYRNIYSAQILPSDNSIIRVVDQLQFRVCMPAGCPVLACTYSLFLFLQSGYK
jgi:hypothetical protein